MDLMQSAAAVTGIFDSTCRVRIYRNKNHVESLRLKTKVPLAARPRFVLPSLLILPKYEFPPVGAQFSCAITYLQTPDFSNQSHSTLQGFIHVLSCCMQVTFD